MAIEARNFQPLKLEKWNFLMDKKSRKSIWILIWKSTTLLLLLLPSKQSFHPSDDMTKRFIKSLKKAIFKNNLIKKGHRFSQWRDQRHPITPFLLDVSYFFSWHVSKRRVSLSMLFLGHSACTGHSNRAWEK